jgi:hypothetical protein
MRSIAKDVLIRIRCIVIIHTRIVVYPLFAEKWSIFIDFFMVHKLQNINIMMRANREVYMYG